jgi:DNA-binding GntR family transcriptional regulator
MASMSAPLLVRSRARDQVRELVRQMIEEGQLRSGERLEEVSLSQRIGVSRTPTREALIALEGDGFVQSMPNRGFVVTPVNEAMVREVYPIIAALETAALRSVGLKLQATLPQLREINEKYLSARTKPRQYEFDQAFHQVLTGACTNRRLLDLLQTQRATARRFDGAHRRGAANHEGSHREHAAIIAAIAAGDIDRAVAVLGAHWRHGEDVVARWLEQST